MYDYLKNSIELLQYYEPLALQADPRGYCVCSSFGKDSVALLEIFRQSGVKHFVQWNITGIDPPELVYFAREQCKKLETRGIDVFAPKPTVPMCKLIEINGLPTRRMRFCCVKLKERRLPEIKNAWHSFGVRKAESVKRSKREELEIITGKGKGKIAMPFDREQLFLFNDNHENRREFENCTAKGVRALNPMIYWDDAYLWDFIRSNGVEFCSLYCEGFKRLGCVGCPMAGNARKEEFRRWPGFYKYYLSAFERMLLRRREHFSNDKHATIWKTPQDVMDWWLEEKNMDENQLSWDDFEVI